MAGSDLIVVNAGLARKPGMSRSDVLEANVAIIDSIIDDALKFAPDSKILMVTNPEDVLTYRVWHHTGRGRDRVFVLAGVLDASRMASFIAAETGFSWRDITTLCWLGTEIPWYLCPVSAPSMASQEIALCAASAQAVRVDIMKIPPIA